jgi:glycosyltransferase involved in cell wall biosynthesis
MLLSVIIPVYNEEKTIRAIFNKVKNIPIEKEIILVNDGSRDSTPQILDGLKSRSDPGPYLKKVVVAHKSNGGKGSAIKLGIAEASGDVILFQDADLEYDPGDYATVIQPILGGEAKAVIGSRFMQKQYIWTGGKPSWKYVRNRLGLGAITWLTNILFFRHVSDYEGCYKAFDAKLLKQVPIEASGFEIDNEIVCKIFRLGHSIKEVPIHFYPRSYEEGKKIRVKDGFKILWAIVKWRFKPFKLNGARSEGR